MTATMELCRIHVGQKELKANQEDGGNRPVLAIRKTLEDGTEQVTFCNEVRIGQVCIRYCPNDPLSCGARVWIEAPTDALEILR
jgi:hypothetical protein